jgi:hypothetical protein
MGLPVVMSIEGDVTAAHSYWTEDGSRIVTEATLHTAAGDVTVSQIGGSAGGYGMIQFPGPALLEQGMHVAVAAHHALDATQNDHVAIDDVKVMAYPPGYVRTGPTKAGHSLYWESHSVSVIVDSAGTTAIDGDGEFPVIDASIATWNTDTASCSDFKVTDAGRQALEVGNDKINLIKFRDTTWGRPAIGNDPARPYAEAAAGITTATYVDDSASSRDGAIVDADIELNGVNFDITIDPVTNDSKNAVLQNTLTHELGHLHGLEHSCRAPDDPPRTDNKGNPVPFCTDAGVSQTIIEATMYPYQDPGETIKETLSDDDVQAICDIYPKSKGGCNTGPGTDVGLLVSSSAIALMLAGRRRRKSPPRG